MGLFGTDIGIDLGTSFIRIYVKGKGVQINEPCIALISQRDKRRKSSLISLGHAAQQMIGREAAGEKTVFPVSNGVVVNNEVAIQLLHALLNYAKSGSQIGKPRVFITYPCNTSPNNKLMLRSLCNEIGAGKTILVSKPFASAAGGGLPVFSPKGSLVVDIGAGTMDIALISLGGIVLSHSISYAGQKMNDSIIAYFRANKMIDITNTEAENLKLDLADARYTLEELKNPPSGKAIVRETIINGKNINQSFDRMPRADSIDIYNALSDSREAIIRALTHVLKNIPIAMIPDVMEKGLFLTGGVSNMPGLRDYISEKLRIQVNPAIEPTGTAIYGLKYLIDNLDNIAKKGKLSFYETE